MQKKSPVYCKILQPAFFVCFSVYVFVVAVLLFLDLKLLSSFLLFSLSYFNHAIMHKLHEALECRSRRRHKMLLFEKKKKKKDKKKKKRKNPLPVSKKPGNCRQRFAVKIKAACQVGMQNCIFL